MTWNLAPTRRIITGVDARGRSRIVEDGPSPATLTVPERPGYRNANLWRTLGAPSLADAPDTIVEHIGVLPPPGGTVIRVIDIPPEAKDPETRAKAAAATFRTMFADASHRPDGRHPGMHVTDTVDYAIVLRGELVAVMEAGETMMKAGDILIQRGTNHAWANRSDDVVRIAFILVDASRSIDRAPPRESD